MFAYRAHIQTLLRGHKYTLFICRSSARWLLEKSVGRFERKDRGECPKTKIKIILHTEF